MKKSNILLSAAVIISLGLSACQKTPDDDAVINKKEGLTETFTEKGSDNKKLQELEVPGEWKEKYGENTDEVPFVISEVHFRYAYIPAREEPENAWLVPVWVFTANSKYVESQNGQVFETENPEDEFLINALDGSYVDANAEQVVKMTR